MSGPHTACAFVPAYERLRAGVLETATGGGHVGLCILLREGTAAWMDHICSSLPLGRARPATSPQWTANKTPPRLAIDGIGADIVHVLVSMLTAGRAQARTCS